jgi:Protein of unknown function (DUF2490)
MKELFHYLITILICFFCNGLFAQSQFSGWLVAFNTFRTGKKTSIHNDIQWRSSDELKHTQTLLLRGGLNVHLNKKFTVTGGYAFIHNRRVINNISGYAPEHRLWEQLLYNHKLKSIFISHRFRLEQRFIARTIVQNNELKNDGSAYANRFRYFIRNILPLQPQQPSFSKGLFASLQNELFVNIGNTANVNGKFFDQNRLYLAVGYRLHSSFDLEAGYMNQYISGRGDVFTTNHVVQLAGYLRL